jgi:hypothetical protein
MIRAIRNRYLGRPRGADRAVHVLAAGLGDLGEHLLGGRVDRLEAAAVDRVDELTVDEEPVRGLDVHHRARLGGGSVFEHHVQSRVK